jgi:MoaA/NifB/PqqE/SkfB family radical SAM enzyme
VKVGFACNNRCVFCAQGHKREGCGAVPFEALVERLRSLAGSPRGLVLTGGEPTLHKRLGALVRCAKALGYHPIQVQTNGRLLSYPHVVRALVDAGVTEFSPSLHGSTAPLHDGLTRAPGSWAESVAGIRGALDSGAVVVTNSVITRANTEDLPQLVSLLASLGVRQAQLAFVHPVGTALERLEDVVPRLPAVVAPVAEARRRALEAGLRLFTEAIPYCFLRGMEELAVEDHIPYTTVVEGASGAFDYSRWRVAEGKAHGPPCERCSAAPRCEGPWREYPQHYGWDEFVPLP